MTNTKCAENEYNLYTELINNLSQFKITSTAENKRQRQGKRDTNTLTTQQCVIEEETKALGVKLLRHPPSNK